MSFRSSRLPKGFAMPEKTELRHDPKRGELIWFGPMSEAERDRLLALSADKTYQQAIRTFFSDSQSKEMDAEFVFAGSGFFVDGNGKRHYMAESGNIICVANFSDATIDVAAQKHGSELRSDVRTLHRADPPGRDQGDRGACAPGREKVTSSQPGAVSQRPAALVSCSPETIRRADACVRPPPSPRHGLAQTEMSVPPVNSARTPYHQGSRSCGRASCRRAFVARCC